MSDQTLVSIVIPCFNGAKYLRQTLECAASQTYSHKEIIIVDDGSTDDSAAIAEAFGPPVRVLRQTNQGESVARNQGAAAACGRYLLFLDADDLLTPDAVAAMVAAAGDSETAVVLSGSAEFHQRQDEPHRVWTPDCVDFFPGLITGNLAPIHSWLVPRDLFVQVGGFWAEQRYAEDYDLWCRLGLTGARLVPVKKVCAFYRRHPGSQFSTSMGTKNYALARAAILARLCQGMLARPDLLQAHGAELFWESMRVFDDARAKGGNISELSGLALQLQALARARLPGLKSSWFVRLTRLVGFRTANFARSLARRRVPPSPAWVPAP